MWILHGSVRASILVSAPRLRLLPAYGIFSCSVHTATMRPDKCFIMKAQRRHRISPVRGFSCYLSLRMLKLRQSIHPQEILSIDGERLQNESSLDLRPDRGSDVIELRVTRLCLAYCFPPLTSFTRNHSYTLGHFWNGCALNCRDQRHMGDAMTSDRG